MATHQDKPAELKVMVSARLDRRLVLAVCRYAEDRLTLRAGQPNFSGGLALLIEQALAAEGYSTRANLPSPGRPTKGDRQ